MAEISSWKTEAFSTDLGWMAVQWRGNLLLRLTFGHPHREAALQSLGMSSSGRPESGGVPHGTLRRRLEGLARGEKQEFHDVELDWTHRTAFQRAVLSACRAVPWGTIVSYSDLAQRAGYPDAARAVGNVMAHNATPLVVPCHRVVSRGGVGCGGFSAPGGVVVKQQLLALEGQFPRPPGSRGRNSPCPATA